MPSPSAPLGNGGIIGNDAGEIDVVILMKTSRSSGNFAVRTSSSGMVVKSVIEVWSASPLRKGNVVDARRHGISNGGGRVSSSAMATSTYNSAELMSRL